MPLNKINTITLAVSIAINAILIFLLLVRFSISPADVLKELKNAELHISMEMAEAKATDEQILKILDERKKWMMELTEALNKGFKDGVFIAPTPPP